MLYVRGTYLPCGTNLLWHIHPKYVPHFNSNPICCQSPMLAQGNPSFRQQLRLYPEVDRGKIIPLEEHLKQVVAHYLLCPFFPSKQYSTPSTASGGIDARRSQGPADIYSKPRPSNSEPLSSNHYRRTNKSWKQL